VTVHIFIGLYLVECSLVIAATRPEKREVGAWICWTSHLPWHLDHGNLSGSRGSQGVGKAFTEEHAISYQLIYFAHFGIPREEMKFEYLNGK